MRLFIPFLSVLLPAVTPEGSGSYEEDVVDIEGCATVAFHGTYLESIVSSSDFCDRTAAELPSGSGLNIGCFSTCTGDGTVDNDYNYDSNGNLQSYVTQGWVQIPSFDDNGAPLEQNGMFACLDVCVKTSVPSALIAAGTVNAYDVAAFLADEISSGAVVAIEQITGEEVAAFAAGQFAASVVNVEFELIEGESSGDEEPTIEPTSEAVSSYGKCMSLYFPMLWMLQTMFSTIFNFCPIFKDHMCYPFEDVGAQCWQTHCSTTCSGDGTPDVNFNGDNDDDAADASDNTANSNGWSGNSVDSGASGNVFGCFDICFKIEATDTQLQEVMTNLGMSARFLNNLGDWFEDVAQDAMVQTFVDGPNEDGTGGYPGGIDGMAQDTEDAGFECDGTCSSANIAEAAASTTYDSEEVETVTGRSCDDGNNGNCSHTCSGAGLNGVCSCPNECWELDGDGESCMIPADKVQLSCESDRMVAYLAVCVVRDNNNFMLGNDNSCNENGGPEGTAIVSNPATACPAEIDDMTEGCVSFDVRLDECSTQVEADYTNNILSFTQNLVSEVQPHMQTGAIGLGAIVSKAARVSVEFTCEYKTDYETGPGNAIVSPDAVNNALESQGAFVFSLNTISRDARMSSGWSIYDSQSDPYMVGSTLYFEICSANILNNIYFSVPDCTVKNANETESYKIMDNHNLDVFVATDRVGRQFGGVYQDWTEAGAPIDMPGTGGASTTEEISNECLVFSYTVFEFITSNDSDGDLRLTCDVHACNYDDDAPEDISACVSASRRRRDTLMHEKFYRVSMNIPIQHTDQV